MSRYKKDHYGAMIPTRTYAGRVRLLGEDPMVSEDPRLRGLSAMALSGFRNDVPRARRAHRASRR